MRARPGRCGLGLAWLIAAGVALSGGDIARAQRDDVVGETELGHFGGGLFVSDVIPSDESTPLGNPREYPGPPVDRLRVRDGYGFGLRLGRNVSRSVTLEAVWSYTISELIREGPIGGRTSVETSYDRLGIVEVGVAALVYPIWIAGDRLGPFIRLGAGSFGWRPADDFPAYLRPINSRRTASLAGWLGAGITYYATEDLALRADYQAITSQLDRDRLLGLEYPFPAIGERSMTAHRLNVGITLRFFDTEL